MNKTSFAAHAGRVAGTVVAVARQIDWAEVGQIVVHGLIACAVAVYVAGEMSGRWLHCLNDRLAQVLAGTSAMPIPARPVAAPITHPLAELAAELEQLTVQQLRTITGIRRKLAKRELVAWALAC